MDAKESRMIAAAVRGDRNGHHAILELYGKQVFEQIARLVDSPLDAEELAQDTFVKAFRHISSFDESKAAFGTWISRVAYNCTINHLKRKKPRLVPFHAAAELYTAHPPATEPVCDEDTDEEKRIQLLEQSIEHLLPDEKALLTFYYYENRSMRDIAYIMDTEPNILSSRLYRIRRKLYKIIKIKQNID
ncbi:MAG: RNA polymerase sigma factor [Prevotellaceae bacterium]|nr:RNA polymerase sigma factor [Prevotellaceae bacterium]